MWPEDDLPYLDTLDPSDQLWVIALAIEETGGPSEYVRLLRALAEQFEHSGGPVGADPIILRDTT